MRIASGTLQAQLGSSRRRRPPIASRTAAVLRDVGLVAAADLEVDDAVPGRGQVARVLHQLLGRVALDEAEVVDLVADRAAEEPVHRLAGGLADDVPERHLEPGEDEVRVPRRMVEAPEMTCLVAEPRDVVDGLADEQRLDRAQRRDGALGGERRRRLADPGDARVGLDLDEHDRRPVVDAAGPVVRLLEGEEQRREPQAGDPDVRSVTAACPARWPRAPARG